MSIELTKSIQDLYSGEVSYEEASIACTNLLGFFSKLQILEARYPDTESKNCTRVQNSSQPNQSNDLSNEYENTNK